MRPLIVTALGVIGLFIASPTPARADCYETCQSSCTDLSGNMNDACVDRCSRAYCQRPSVSYGAIAYGAKSTANGYAFDKSTQAEAERTALQYCRQNGDDCKLVASFSNSCAAVAAVEDQGRFAIGQASTRDDAQNKAMAACQEHGKGDCELEVWTCAKP